MKRLFYIISKRTLTLTGFSLLLLWMLPNQTFASVLLKPANNLGLVAYYSFNDATSTKATDFSGRGNTGTLTDGPTWAAGKQGKALSFDGVDDFLRASNIAAITKNGIFTFSAWIYYLGEGSGQYETIFQNSQSGTDRNGMMIEGNIVRFGYYGGASWTGVSGSLSTNAWTHVVGVNNQRTLSIYLYASLQGGTAGSYVSGESDYLYIGKASIQSAPHNWNPFNGLIDEVRIYNRALGPTEVAALYNSGGTKFSNPNNLGLVGYWSMDDGAGTTATDLSGNGNGGTLNGSATWAAGKRSKALDFPSGSNITDYFIKSNITNWPTDAITTSLWIKTTDSGSDGIISYARDSGCGNNCWLLYNSPSLNIYRGTAVNTGIALNDGRWHHIVVTWRDSDNALIVYKDGEEAYDGSLSASGMETGGTLMFAQEQDSAGGGLDASQSHTGTLDEVRIYNRFLSAAEVAALYNSGAAKVNTSKNTVAPSSLVGWWTFDGAYLNTTTSTDQSGQGNNGTLTGASGAQNKPKPTIGKIGQALNFDGTDDVVSAGDVVDMGTSDMTLSTWFKTADTDFSLVAKSKYGSLAGRYFLTYSGGALHGGFAPVSDHIGADWTTTSILDNQWHNAIVVFDRDGLMTLYVDAVSRATADISLYSATNMNSGCYLLIGMYNHGTDCTTPKTDGLMFTGSIDDVRVYNKALTAAEVLQLYNQGK